MDTGLLFIPDISGFTKFVTQTEIRHSNHIITELMEIILNNNTIKLSVSEIEGDAVLFYKKDNLPALDDLYNLAKKMFIEFHSFLKVIERDNVCQCGACQSASDLTLKFVAHIGEFNEVSVGDFKKLMGSPVILAHRLLKNSITLDEYFLFTNELKTVGEYSFTNESNISINSSEEDYPEFGKVEINYLGLTPLRKEIVEPKTKKHSDFDNSEINFTLPIKAPLLLVHQLLSDNQTKKEWVPGMKNIEESSKINRVNTSHTCVFDDLEVHFITKAQQVKKTEIIYSEEGSVKDKFEFTVDYKMKEINGHTELSFRLLNGINKNTNSNFVTKLFKKLKDKLFLKISIRNQKKSLHLFKAYVERIASEQESLSY